MGTTTKAPVSVIIPTKNEERNIEACLDSVSWADQIFVFDSHSTDQTVEIASRKGSEIATREFDNFSDHKNWALDNLPLRNPWVLIVDADERVTPELESEIRQALINPGGKSGFYIPRKNIFNGTWVKHAGMYPDYQLRLFKKGAARYESRIVHEHMALSGEAGFLGNPFTHDDDKGIERYVDRHNVYSSLEAVEAYRHLFMNTPESGPTGLAALLQSGPHRRRALKHFSYRWLPFRALFAFFWMYLIRAGFLDGRTGFRYCVLRASYEFQIDLKLKELSQDGSPMREKYAHYLDGGI